MLFCFVKKTFFLLLLHLLRLLLLLLLLLLVILFRQDRQAMAEVVAPSPSPSPAPAPASAVSVASSDQAPRLVDGNEIHEPLKKHPLEHSWTIWFDNTGKTKQSSWGSALRSVYTFSNVEDFWWYVPSSLSDYFLLVRLSARFFPFFSLCCIVFFLYRCVFLLL